MKVHQLVVGSISGQRAMRLMNTLQVGLSNKVMQAMQRLQSGFVQSHKTRMRSGS